MCNTLGAVHSMHVLSAVADTLCKEGSLKKKPLGFISSLTAKRDSNIPKLHYTAILEVCVFWHTAR